MQIIGIVRCKKRFFGGEDHDELAARGKLGSQVRQLVEQGTHAKPQKLTQEFADGASLLIIMSGGDKCPYVPGLRRDDWPLRSQGAAVERL